MSNRDYYSAQEIKWLKERTAAISHAITAVLSAGCIFTTGVWLLFIATLFLLERIF